MKVNVSYIKEHLECPQKAYYHYHLLRAPRRRILALELGTLWHKMMEGKLHGLSDPFIEFGIKQELSVAELEQDFRDELDKALTSILPAFRQVTFPKDWKVIETERIIETIIPGGHVLQGRLDAVVEWNRYFWHLQHKTVAASKPISLYAQEMERDWHECAYQYLAEKAGFSPYQGTILHTLRKLSPKSIQENPARAVTLQYVPREQFQIVKAIQDISTVASQIEVGYRNPLLVVQNRSSCMGRFGNSPCPYLGVCNHQVALYDDAVFESVVDRYDAPSQETEPQPTEV